MTPLYATVAIGTAATVLATILVLLRAQFHGRRPVVALARRWATTGARTSSLVVALLAAIAAVSFASIPALEQGAATNGLALNMPANAPSMKNTVVASNDSPGDSQALADLRVYANKIDAEAQPNAGTPSIPSSVEVPAVDTMIAKLVARLEKEPSDVRGWKMLGWSYLNTDKPQEAARAYETALKLQPGDEEIRKGLEAAKSAQTAKAESSTPVTAKSPTAEDIKAADSLSDSERDGMIRGMVDKLATRLETSPKDEEGWLRLMRSRMTLGENDAAKAALAKALETFASDEAAKARLTAAARELGVASN
ncbi:MAG: tetratricopeptide repeat protein [Hyphomicrobium sp.]